MHVSIDADREVAKDGMLFETSGLEFTSPGKDTHRLKDAQRLALAAAVDDDNDFARKLGDGLACSAGERRIISWRKSITALPPCHGALEQAMAENVACPMSLLTTDA